MSKITVDGKEMEAEFIGRGSYSQAFRVGDRVYLITDPWDYTKRILSERFQTSKNPHIPKIARHADQANGMMTFSMPYYPPLDIHDNPAASATFDTVRQSKMRANPLKPNIERAKEMARDKTIPKAIRGALYGMAHAINKYGKPTSWFFDLSLGNTSYDDNHNLVLRDILAP